MGMQAILILTHACYYGARRIRIDCNIVLSQFNRSGLRQPSYGKLGRAVGRNTGATCTNEFLQK
jgi:hypothetical protein